MLGEVLLCLFIPELQLGRELYIVRGGNRNLALDCAAFGIFQISIDQLHAQFFDPVISIKDSVVATNFSSRDSLIKTLSR